MRLLVVEDEAALRDDLVRQLSAEGFVVDAAADGEEGLYAGTEFALDAAIFDLGLPGRSGIDVIRELRANGRDFPILILTARDSWQDKVVGLEAGADDYLAKPFHFEELLARVRALLRRAAGWSTDTLRFDSVELDTRGQTLKVNAASVELTAYEYKVIEYLMLNAGEVVSKATLGEHVYGEDLDPDSNVLEVLIGRVRRKLDPNGDLKPVETLRGRGYRFALARS
ncbi:MAG: response regulator transcription factor [Pseudomonadota bacterium]